MKPEVKIKGNLTLTDEKIKTMCRLGFEDNDYLFTMRNGRNIIIDKRKNIIHIEGSDSIELEQYIKYLQDVQEKRDKRIILTTLSPDTHRTSEENLGIAYLAAVLRKKGYNVEIIDGWLAGLADEKVYKRIMDRKDVAVVGVSCYMSNNDKSIQNEIITKKTFTPHLHIDTLSPMRFTSIQNSQNAFFDIQNRINEQKKKNFIYFKRS